jgi:hypothetical protein
MSFFMGLLRELNPGPLAPEARIIPLDQAAKCLCSQTSTSKGTQGRFWVSGLGFVVLRFRVRVWVVGFGVGV